MMKQFRKISFGLLVCLLFSWLGVAAKGGSYASNPWGYPSIVQVQKYMLDHYQGSGWGVRNWVFEKRKEGYWVGKNELNQRELTDKELLWSAETGKFLPLKNYAKSDGPFGYDWNYPSGGSIRDIRYDYAPYYGYAGWAEDALADFVNWEGGTAAEMYGIGLAWNVHASNLLSLNSPWALKEVLLPRTVGNPPFTQPDWDKWSESANMSIYWMNMAAASDPGMLTFIGSLHTKALNEVMAAWLNNWVYEGNMVARKWLTPGMYDEVSLGMARAMLESCDVDAILFTQGDMDTYPLLYVQEQEQYRKDVQIVNLSLLNWPDYALAVRKKMGLRFALMDTEIQQIKYMTLGDDPSVQAYTDWVNALRVHDKHEVFKVKGKTVWLPGKAGTEGIKLEIKENYLSIGNWLMLDILFGYAGKQPIYFTDPPNFFQQSDAWIDWEGWVYQLKMVPNSEDKVSPKWDSINQSLMGKNEWLNGDVFHKADDRWFELLVTRKYLDAIDLLLEKGDNPSAKGYLAYFVSRFGEEWVFMDEWESMYERAVKIGDLETAKLIATRLATHFRNGDYEGYPNCVLYWRAMGVFTRMKEKVEAQGWKDVLKIFPKKLKDHGWPLGESAETNVGPR